MANHSRQQSPLQRSAKLAASGLLTTTWFLMQSLVALPPAIAQTEAEDDQLSYGEFLELVDSGQVDQVDIDPGIQKGQLAQALGRRLHLLCGVCHDLALLPLSAAAGAVRDGRHPLRLR